MKSYFDTESCAFWSNVTEHPNEPPHVHVAHFSESWEGRIGLLTGTWLELPALARNPDSVLALFRGHRVRCMEAWHSLHRGRVAAPITYRRHGASPLPAADLNTCSPVWVGNSRWAEARERRAWALRPGSQLPPADGKELSLRTNAALSGLWLTSADGGEFLCPLDYLWHTSSPGYLRRMADVRTVGNVVLGQMVRLQRLALGEDQEALARAVRVTVKVVSLIEDGKADFDLRLMTRVATALGLKITDLFMDRYALAGPGKAKVECNSACVGPEANDPEGTLGAAAPAELPPLPAPDPEVVL